MTTTYLATLCDGVLDWGDDGPPATPKHVPVKVQVTMLPQAKPEPSASSRAALAILEALAASGGLPEFGDPVAWQIETRKDRPLPGRDE